MHPKDELAGKWKTRPLTEYLGTCNAVLENEVGVRKWIQVNNYAESFEEDFSDQLRRKIKLKYQKSKRNIIDQPPEDLESLKQMTVMYTRIGENNNSDMLEKILNDSNKTLIEVEGYYVSKQILAEWGSNFFKIVTTDAASQTIGAQEGQCLPKNDDAKLPTPTLCLKQNKAINTVPLYEDKATETDTDDDCRFILSKNKSIAVASVRNITTTTSSISSSPMWNTSCQEVAKPGGITSVNPEAEKSFDETDARSNADLSPQQETDVLAAHRSPTPVQSNSTTAPLASVSRSPYNPYASTFQPSREMFKLQKAQEWQPKNEDERKAFEQLKTDVYNVLVVSKACSAKHLATDFKRIVQEPLNLEPAGIPGIKVLLVQMGDSDLIYLRMTRYEEVYVFPKLSGKAYQQVSHVEELVSGQRDTNIRFPVPHSSTLVDCDYLQLFKEPQQLPVVSTSAHKYNNYPYYNPQSGLFHNPYQQYNNNDIVYRTPHQRQAQLQQQQFLFNQYNTYLQQQQRLQNQQQQNPSSQQSQQGILPNPINPMQHPTHQYQYNFSQQYDNLHLLQLYQSAYQMGKN